MFYISQNNFAKQIPISISNKLISQVIPVENKTSILPYCSYSIYKNTIFCKSLYLDTEYKWIEKAPLYDIRELHLTPDLLNKNQRNYSYITCEALYYIFKALGKHHDFVPMYIHHNNTTHWFLYDKTNRFYWDPTWWQFTDQPPYHLNKSCGLFIKKPSKRCIVLLQRIRAQHPHLLNWETI